MGLFGGLARLEELIPTDGLNDRFTVDKSQSHHDHYTDQIRYLTSRGYLYHTTVYNPRLTESVETAQSAHPPG